MPAVRRTQEDSHTFWANLVYIVKSRLARGILETHLKGKKQQIMIMEETMV